MNEFKSLLGKTVNKLFLYVWPPWGEEEQINRDISFGFIFNDEPKRLCIIRVDKDELWRPHIEYQPLPQSVYSWEDFCPRMEKWKIAKEDTDMILDFEYYDVTGWAKFQSIIESRIIGIELIGVKDIPDPFGIKILFENDYVISMPNSDGNTVETKIFNKNNAVDYFKYLGSIECSDL